MIFDLGKVLYELRIHTVLSQGEAAAALGVAQSQLSRWETSSVVPSPSWCGKLAAFYQLPALAHMNQADWWKVEGEFIALEPNVEVVGPVKGKVYAASAGDVAQVVRRLRPRFTVKRIVFAGDR